jgi:hypothetical protein
MRVGWPILPRPNDRPPARAAIPDSPRVPSALKSADTQMGWKSIAICDVPS